MCQGRVCTCSKETVFSKYHLFGNSRGVSGELIKPAIRQSMVPSSYHLLEPFHPVFLSFSFGLSLPLAQQDHPHHYWVRHQRRLKPWHCSSVTVCRLWRGQVLCHLAVLPHCCSCGWGFSPKSACSLPPHFSGDAGPSLFAFLMEIFLQSWDSGFHCECVKVGYLCPVWKQGPAVGLVFVCSRRSGFGWFCLLACKVDELWGTLCFHHAFNPLLSLRQ